MIKNKLKYPDALIPKYPARENTQNVQFMLLKAIMAHY